MNYNHGHTKRTGRDDHVEGLVSWAHVSLEGVVPFFRGVVLGPGSTRLARTQAGHRSHNEQ